MVPENLKYTKEHEWVRLDRDEAVIGITDYAQSELGDIIFLELPTVGDSFNQDDTIGTIEAVKTLADLYIPISGEIIEINNMIEDMPEIINSDPYDKGWIIEISPSSRDSEIKALLSPQEYADVIKQLAKK